MAYNLERVQKEFREVCIAAGASEVLNVPIKINGRLTKTLGRVFQEYDEYEDKYVSTLVEFSRQLIETSTDKSIHDVIMHEAAHFIVTARTGETHGHDKVFKQICAEIGATSNGTTTKVERTVSDEKIYKYTVFCPTCNAVIGGYSRMCKTIKNIDNCTCNVCKCGGLKVIQNW